MRSAIFLALGVALICTLEPSRAQTTPLPGTDIRSWATANIASRLSLAGTWTPADGPLANVSFWNVMRLGAEQREGIVVGAWLFNTDTSVTMPDVTPTRAAVFEQQPDGTLQEATARLFGDPTTYGVGDVIVADFNRDNRDDVLLPSYNESPLLRRPGVAYVSEGDGLRKFTTNPTAAHHSSLFEFGGSPRAISQSFVDGGRGTSQAVVSQWNGSGFTLTNLGDIGGMSIVAGDFTNNGDLHIVTGDSSTGPGRSYSPTNELLPFAYKANNFNVTLPAIPLPRPYFNGKPEYAQFPSGWDPVSKTHSPRLLATDLNHDGLLDVVALATIWRTGRGHQRGTLQLMLNRGNMQFADDTDALAPEYAKTSKIDYSARLADVDGSGIATWFLAALQVNQVAEDETQQGQYILVNDGTGRLYAAIHDEFRAMRQQVSSFAAARVPNSSIGSGFTPQYFAYRTPNGGINFLAALRTMIDGRPARAFVNVALQINLTTDFRRDITIPTRNNSRRIRTFAGNDTIHRAASDPSCSIDGGLGSNVAVYPGPRANWVVTREGGRATVAPAAGTGGTDTLTRIQTARFADGDVDLRQ